MVDHICRFCKHAKTIPPGLYVASSQMRDAGEDWDSITGPNAEKVKLIKGGIFLAEKPPNITAEVKEFIECTEGKKTKQQAGGSPFTGVAFKYYYGENCSYWIEKEEE